MIDRKGIIGNLIAKGRSLLKRVRQASPSTAHARRRVYCGTGIEPAAIIVIRKRWAARNRWCANHMGDGFCKFMKRPTLAPAPGCFWKQDRNNGYWRLYRKVL